MYPSLASNFQSSYFCLLWLRWQIHIGHQTCIILAFWWPIEVQLALSLRECPQHWGGWTFSCCSQISSSVTASCSLNCFLNKPFTLRATDPDTLFFNVIGIFSVLTQRGESSHSTNVERWFPGVTAASGSQLHPCDACHCLLGLTFPRSELCDWFMPNSTWLTSTWEEILLFSKRLWNVSYQLVFEVRKLTDKKVESLATILQFEKSLYHV